MAVSAWDRSLGIQESFDILRQCSLFLFSQHEPDKICFYPTKIVLEGNSMIWRTGAEWLGGIQKLWTGTDPEPSRDLEKLVKLINKVHKCLQHRDAYFLHYVKDSSEKRYAWIDLLKEAKNGLTRLKDQQYAGYVGKQNIVLQAINTLVETEKLFNTDEVELETVLAKLSEEDADTLRRVIRRKDDKIHHLEHRYPLPEIILH